MLFDRSVDITKRDEGPLYASTGVQLVAENCMSKNMTMRIDDFAYDTMMNIVCVVVHKRQLEPHYLQYTPVYNKSSM